MLKVYPLEDYPILAYLFTILVVNPTPPNKDEPTRNRFFNLS
jgi:hypothetical protein